MFLSLTQVDASNIYGDNLQRQLQLRLHKDGKLKYQVVKYTQASIFLYITLKCLDLSVGVHREYKHDKKELSVLIWDI